MINLVKVMSFVLYLNNILLIFRSLAIESKILFPARDKCTTEVLSNI